MRIVQSFIFFSSQCKPTMVCKITERKVISIDCHSEKSDRFSYHTGSGQHSAYKIEIAGLPTHLKQKQKDRITTSSSARKQRNTLHISHLPPQLSIENFFLSRLTKRLYTQILETPSTVIQKYQARFSRNYKVRGSSAHAATFFPGLPSICAFSNPIQQKYQINKRAAVEGKGAEKNVFGAYRRTGERLRRAGCNFCSRSALPNSGRTRSRAICWMGERAASDTDTRA